MKTIQTNKAPAAIGPYSQAIEANKLIFTSGQIALNEKGEFVEGDVTIQTKQVMKNLKEILKQANSNLNLVVKTTCFLANMDDFAKFNAEYEKAFKGHKPARSTIAVKTLPKNALVEVEVIAVKKK